MLTLLLPVPLVLLVLPPVAAVASDVSVRRRRNGSVKLGRRKMGKVGRGREGPLTSAMLGRWTQCKLPSSRHS